MWCHAAWRGTLWGGVGWGWGAWHVMVWRVMVSTVTCLSIFVVLCVHLIVPLASKKLKMMMGYSK